MSPPAVERGGRPAPSLARVSGRRRAALKRRLESLRSTFGARWLDTDPVGLVHRYSEMGDLEIAGFLAAGLAFGNVRAIRASVSKLLDALGPSPGLFVDRFDPAASHALSGIRHRWIRPEDIAALLGVLREIRARSESLGGFFLEGFDAADEDVEAGLDSFSSRARRLHERLAGAGSRARPAGGSVAAFFPRPADGSACKRLCLFLRWMVRENDGVDLGLWKGVAPRHLVLPLDTHLARVSRALGLTRRRTAGWPMAVEATRSLALLDPRDPVRYDFALSRLGILDLCLHGAVGRECPRCAPPRRGAWRRVRAGESV